MTEYDIASWVDREEEPRKRQLREAIHTVLFAIANKTFLNVKMIMKGGILLAIKYDCSRYTTDIDFSTDIKSSSFDREKFISELQSGLTIATESLEYGMACQVQSAKLNPPGPGATFPTLQIKVGYAYKNDKKGYKGLLDRRAINVVKIDYSFNEKTQNIELMELAGGGTLNVYSFIDIVAEKMRAILQQVKRNRFRRQDVYDIFFLLEEYSEPSDDEKQKILALREKSDSRGVNVSKDSMSNKEVIERSKKLYHHLSSEVEGDLPDFEVAYTRVKELYESLPWD